MYHGSWTMVNTVLIVNTSPVTVRMLGNTLPKVSLKEAVYHHYCLTFLAGIYLAVPVLLLFSLQTILSVMKLTLIPYTC